MTSLNILSQEKVKTEVQLASEWGRKPAWNLFLVEMKSHQAIAGKVLWQQNG